MAGPTNLAGFGCCSGGGVTCEPHVPTTIFAVEILGNPCDGNRGLAQWTLNYTTGTFLSLPLVSGLPTSHTGSFWISSTAEQFQDEADANCAGNACGDTNASLIYSPCISGTSAVYEYFYQTDAGWPAPTIIPCSLPTASTSSSSVWTPNTFGLTGGGPTTSTTLPGYPTYFPPGSVWFQYLGSPIFWYVPT
jgi:hypothetical protein